MTNYEISHVLLDQARTMMKHLPSSISSHQQGDCPRELGISAADIFHHSNGAEQYTLCMKVHSDAEHITQHD